jgi:hypothetical protein
MSAYGAFQAPGCSLLIAVKNSWTRARKDPYDPGILIAGEASCGSGPRVTPPRCLDVASYPADTIFWVLSAIGADSLVPIRRDGTDTGGGVPTTVAEPISVTVAVAIFIFFDVYMFLFLCYVFVGYVFKGIVYVRLSSEYARIARAGV